MQVSVNHPSVQLSFRQKEQLFHELSQLAKSGIPLGRGLEVMGRSHGAISSAARRIAKSLERDRSLSGAFRAAGFSASDAAIIEAGEANGRLDQIYPELQSYYAQLAESKSLVIRKMMYPLVVLHLGAFLLSIAPAIMGDGWPTFWKNVIPVLLFFYALIVLLFFLFSFIRRSFASSAVLTRIFGLIPVIGGLLVSWTAWKFSLVLSLYVRSGGGLLRAFGIAGSSSDNALLNAAAEGAVRRVQNGESLAEALRGSSRLPSILERAIETGEHAGRLDEEIYRAAELYREQFTQRLLGISEWVPRLLYIVILLLLGYRIIESYMGVMSGVQSVIDEVS